MNLEPISDIAIIRDENIDADSEFRKIRIKYFEFLTGGSNYDLNDMDIKAKINEIDSATQHYIKTMSKLTDTRTSIWADLTMAQRTGPGGSFQMTNTFLRLATMAAAYRTKGSVFEGDTAIRDGIVDALKWMNTNIFNTLPAWGNWWDWQIGTPIEVNKCLTLMYDDLPEDLLYEYVNALKAKVPLNTANSPGDSNIIWIKFNSILTGVIAKEQSIINTAMTALSNGFFKYNTTGAGNGFYPDGSYVMHGGFAYTGSYGASLIETIAKVIYLTEDTPWKLNGDSRQVLYQWVEKAFAPLIYKGIMMDMVRGRAISRQTESDHLIGHVVIRSIFLIAQTASPDIAVKLKSMVKYWALNDTFRSIYKGKNVINNNNSVYFINKIKELINDPDIISMEEPVGHHRFPSMDRVVHVMPGFGFGISMHSDRINNYESINGNNLKGWHTGDGMTYLYNGDQGQYTNNFWATVNPFRLTGTTVNQNTTAQPHQKNGSSWVGGAEILGKYGITGMQFRPYGKTLDAKKSWFMFDDEIVALGSGITSSDGVPVESVIENRKLRPGGNNALIVNGELKQSDAGWSEIVKGVDWAYLEDGVGGTGIGYYFPGGADVNCLRENRSGKWHDIDSNGEMADDIEYIDSYVTLWFDHFTDPKDASYSYVLLPNKTSAETGDYAKNPGIRILENSSEAQAVKKISLNIVGVNFWYDVPKTIDFITSDRKASVITKETYNDIEISISDPTQLNTGVINIELHRQAKLIISKDSNIEVNQLGPTIKLIVHTANLQGRTVKAKFGY